MKKILNYFLILFLGILIISCETKNNNIAVDFGSSSDLEPSSIEIPIHAQTHIIDSVRSDEANLLIPIGTSSSTAFGKTKSSFASQVYYSGVLGRRLGDNAKLNMVRLEIPINLKPLSRSEYNTLLNDKNKTRLVKGNNRKDVDTLVTQYTVDSIFNKRSNNLALSIYKLANKLDAFSVDYYSDGKSYGKDATGTGFNKESQKFGGSTVKTTIEDTIYAFYNSTTKKYSFSKIGNEANYKIELNKDKFETIFEEVQNGSITNETIFKQKFPGIVIEPDNEEGFTFLSKPSGISIKMDYTYTTKSTSDGETTSKTKNSTVAFKIRENSEHRVSKYERKRSDDFRDAEDKSESLYLQGQGGSEVLLTIDKKALEDFKNSIRHNGKLNASIIEAYIDLYVDESKTDRNSSIPFYLHLYDNHLYDKKYKREIGDFLLFNRGANLETYKKRIGGIYDKKQKKYRFKVTKHIKDIIEERSYIDPKDTRKEKEIKIENVQLAIRIGQHIRNSFIDTNRSDASVLSTDNRYHPGEFVAYGTEANENKKLKLVILYTKTSKNN